VKWVKPLRQMDNEVEDKHVEDLLHIERPPIRELLKKLIAEDPEAVRAIGEATGHDVVAYVKEQRGKGEDDL